jgi:hypothetical protein
MNCALSGLKVPSLKRFAPPTAHAINRAVTEAFGCISGAAASEAAKPEMAGATQMLISWHWSVSSWFIRFQYNLLMLTFMLTSCFICFFFNDCITYIIHYIVLYNIISHTIYHACMYHIYVLMYMYRVNKLSCI